MPLYEYRCESCEHQFEVIQKFSDPHVSVCPKCGGGPVVKLISSPAFTFKGTGFYITDYARKDQGKGDQDKSGRPRDGRQVRQGRQEHRVQAPPASANQRRRRIGDAGADEAPRRPKAETVRRLLQDRPQVVAERPGDVGALEGEVRHRLRGTPACCPCRVARRRPGRHRWAASAAGAATRWSAESRRCGPWRFPPASRRCPASGCSGR